MPPGSDFAERFEFARIHQAFHGRRENDAEFAKAIGVVAGSITEYKSLLDPPPHRRILAIAARCGVDPGWLAYGEDCATPAPAGFAAWYAKQDHSPLLPPLPPDEEEEDPRKRGGLAG